MNWYGTQYTFSPKQAAVVKMLYEQWLAGTPEVSQEALLETAGSEGGRLVDLFKRDKDLFHTIVASGKKKGTYRLNRPDPPPNR